jgi:hypothetical protein
MSGRTSAPAPSERPLSPSIMRRLTGTSNNGGARPGPADGHLKRLVDGSVRSLRLVPRAAWICALVATLNAACWSIITPPFQLPDEPSHFAYVQQLAENERLPTSDSSVFSEEEQVVLRDLDHRQVRWHPETHTISSKEQQRQLASDLAQHLSRDGHGAAGGAASSPPLYYLLQTVPYTLASSGTLLDQLESMRLLSALMGGLTALFVFMFLRETLPAVRWAWTVGGLSVALAPLLGYMSGAVNPDAMLFAVSAATFYCLSRAFRRGLTRRLAIAIGALTAVGYLTKLNFIGLIPGVILGLIVLSIRASRARGRRDAYLSLGIALGVAAGPVFVYALANLLSNHPVLGIASTTLKEEGGGRSIPTALSYIWQLYLPRLPGMVNYFPGLSTTRLWFDNSVGLYGWLDTSFPRWVDSIALLPAGLLVLLCARTTIARRAVLRRRLYEVTVYGAMGVGLVTLIGATDFLNREGAGFSEPRYLLPMLPLVGAMLVLAARGAGRRWGPAVGALIVMLFLAHDVFSQLQVVSRFYG